MGWFSEAIRSVWRAKHHDATGEGELRAAHTPAGEQIKHAARPGTLPSSERRGVKPRDAAASGGGARDCGRTAATAARPP